MKSKNAQFNFVWLFAIIAGGAILALAIYGAIKIGDTQRYKTDTEIGKKISIITDPLQAGFSEGSFGKIVFKQETRINNDCLDNGFGENRISVATKSRIGKEWNLAGGATSIKNKYIFSSSKNSGEEYYVFSKPFYFPFKVADLIFLTSQNYCFINAPDQIAEEVESLNIENIKIDNCSENDIKVCFGSGNCDINVYGTCMSNCDSVYDEGYVEKAGQKMNYVGALMYAGIFSDKEIYDCNVKRLMYRLGKISEIFAKKTDLMNARDCNTNLKADLILLSSMAMNTTSDNLVAMNNFVKQLETKNEKEVCGVW